MSKKGLRREAEKKFTQKMGKQENKLYYQNSTEQKSPRTEDERKTHRKVENQKS